MDIAFLRKRLVLQKDIQTAAFANREPVSKKRKNFFCLPQLVCTAPGVPNSPGDTHEKDVQLYLAIPDRMPSLQSSGKHMN